MAARTLLLLTILLPMHAPSQSTQSQMDIRVHSAGNVRRVVANGILSPQQYRGPVCEYPAGGGVENGFAGYPVLELAAAMLDHDSLRFVYTQWWEPETEPWDSIWAVKDFETMQIPFWPSYAGLTDEDFVYRCRNDAPHVVSRFLPGRSEPVSLSIPPVDAGMHVSSMTWNIPPLNDIILTRYRIFPRRERFTDLFLSLYFRGGIGLAGDSYWRASDDRTMYVPDAHISIVSDGGMSDGIQSSNCVGYRLFPPRDIPPSRLRWTTKDDFSRESVLWPVSSPTEYAAVMHSLLSSNVQMGGNILGSNWVAVGPFQVDVGDTLEIWGAEIFGTGVTDVLDKNALLDRLSQRGFISPHAPPAPPLRVERGDKSVTLRWDARPGETDPESYRDTCRWDGMDLPFEGYRVYRSTQSLDGPWTMISEYDIAGDGFGREFGLQREYTETGLLNHATYYYAVTAFSKPDTTVGLPARESRLQSAKVAAIPGTPARPGIGEVAVVPNPYRSDIPYTAYDPPWERPAGKWRTWTESDRRVQFTHLPRDCVISIYTLAGDLVDLIRHSDAALSFQDWNLTSYVGQAVASGIYLFTVEDVSTGEVQVGKFVVIR